MTSLNLSSSQSHGRGRRRTAPIIIESSAAGLVTRGPIRGPARLNLIGTVTAGVTVADTSAAATGVSRPGPGRRARGKPGSHRLDSVTRDS